MTEQWNEYRTVKTIHGPTPNGGVKSEMHFLDDDHMAVRQEEASQVIIVEYDQDGSVIQRTYGKVGDS